MLTLTSFNPSVILEYGKIKVTINELAENLLTNPNGCRMVFDFIFTPSGEGQTGSLMPIVNLLSVTNDQGATFAGLIDRPASIANITSYPIQVSGQTLENKVVSLSANDILNYNFEIDIRSLQGSGFVAVNRRFVVDTQPAVQLRSDAVGLGSLNAFIKYYPSRLQMPQNLPAKPLILEVQKASMGIGEENYISGANFGVMRGQVIIADQPLLPGQITLWSDTQIQFVVDKTFVGSDLALKVYRPDIDQYSNSNLQITVTPPPIPILERTNFAGNSTKKGLIQKLILSGQNFGLEIGQVALDVSVLEVVTWLENRIECNLTGEETSGDLYIVSSLGEMSNRLAFTFTDATPIIDSVVPETVEENGVIAVIGRNFGNTYGQVLLGEPPTKLDITSWTDTSIVASVPLGTQSGSIKVVAGLTALESQTASLAVVPISTTSYTPIVSRITPAGGPPGTTITIYGSNFGQFKSGTSFATIGTVNIELIPTSWTDRTVVGKIPINAKTGYIKVNTKYGLSNDALFIVADELLPNDVVIHPKPVANNSSPIITRTDPSYSGHAGSKLTIFGENFGRTQGHVKWRELELPVVAGSWTRNSVQVTLPNLWSTAVNADLIERDLLYVYNEIGFSNKISFAILAPAPAISSIAPLAPVVGDELVINGSFFGDGTDPETNMIRFGVTPDRVIHRLDIATWTNTQIKFVIPDDVDYTMGQIQIVAQGIKSDWHDITIEYDDSTEDDDVSIGDIKNKYGQLIATSKRSVPPIVNIPAGAPTVANLDADKLNGRHWEDLVEYVEDKLTRTPALMERLNTINGVAPDSSNNITLCGAGNIEVIPNPDANEIIISGTPVDNLETQTGSQVIVNYGGIIEILGEDGVIVTNQDGVVSISLDVGLGVNQVAAGDHTHNSQQNPVVYL